MTAQVKRALRFHECIALHTFAPQTSGCACWNVRERVSVYFGRSPICLSSALFQRSSIPRTASVYALNISVLRAFKLLNGIFELRTVAAGDIRRHGYTVRLHGHR